MIRVEVRAHHKGTYTDVTLILPFQHSVPYAVFCLQVEQRLRQEHSSVFAFPITDVEIRRIEGPREDVLIHRGIHPNPVFLT